MSFQIRFSVWVKRRKHTIKLLRELADKIDSMENTMNGTKLAGTVASVATGVVGLVCVAATPFTGGLSLTGFANIGLLGGALGIGTAVGKHFLEKEYIEKVKQAVAADHTESKKMQEALSNGLFDEREIPVYPELASVNFYKDCGKTISLLKLRSGTQFAFVTVGTLYLDINEIISTLNDIRKGSTNESAASARRIAEQLEEEMNYNERLMTKQVD